jgi:aldose sugar dehydrogenase
MTMRITFLIPGRQNKLLFLFPTLLILTFGPAVEYFIYAQEEGGQEGEEEKNIPDVNVSIGGETPNTWDPNLKVEVIAEGLEFPTTMAFLGPDDILVLEKEKGTVQRIVNGNILPEPLLDVNVATSQERCMCGIAISKNFIPGHTYVFLYYTETELSDGEDVNEGKSPVGNRLYRYELVNNKLVNPKLLLDLPATPGPRHNGGAISIGLDNNLYIPIGDVDGSHKGGNGETQTQNYPNGVEPDGRSGILRITLDGQPVPNGGIIGQENPLDLYYAYGIRNSFGIDFDPVTGKLWDTENGPGYGDEINLVEPGFNSGWVQIQGMGSTTNNNGGELDPFNLVDFDGMGKYSDPKFEWSQTLGPTAIKFLSSDKLGTQYQNDMFVGSIVTGIIYHFDLNEDRTELILTGELEDKIAEIRETGEEDIVFAEGFAGVSDLEVGPHDGYLYVVSLGQGKIFRIVPGALDTAAPAPAIEETSPGEENEEIEQDPISVEDEEEQEDDESEENGNED